MTDKNPIHPQITPPLPELAGQICSLSERSARSALRLALIGAGFMVAFPFLMDAAIYLFGQDRNTFATASSIILGVGFLFFLIQIVAIVWGIRKWAYLAGRAAVLLAPVSWLAGFLLIFALIIYEDAWHT